MTDAATLAERYIAVWNERDPDRRSTLVAETFAEGATYGDPLAEVEGHAGIDGLVAAVQAQFPDFRFAPAGSVDAYGDRLRFSWTLGPASGPAVAGGTDFATIASGRFASVVGFLDFAPG
ncbi:nuclear transport factor 2 family protein [Mesorhizobium sp. BR1-1-16]|uniref:nuclear transport factor 2 family protein n=1 Tax=Mesorhizobium sp. BR1-1-16 TaxID=2876653 RepID=UPI001CCBD296|nr:nuclear transport factor 2 family protein [Mesorhizobium sp. BR1-1-16]MBZ9938263.1 nuclear transport factor 2 family protein [Mesorhizobium sp. BR1-1-16]